MKIEPTVGVEKNWSVVVWSIAAAISIALSYALTLMFAVACLSLMLLATAGIGGILLGLFGAVAGLTILWSLVPRREKFQEPGILVDLSREKRLAEEIEAVARFLGEATPDQVYLVPQPNAFVMQPSGFLGANRRRVMGLGLPLMAVLSVSEFRAILAHEFGHFFLGDTRLGPWIYNARTAMARVLTNLGESSDALRFLRKWVVVNLAYSLLMSVLVFYWKLFLRFTQIVSRKQEYRSDELACRAAGSQAHIDGLRLTNRVAATFPMYWQTVVLPIIAAGYRPPLSDGFARFMRSRKLSRPRTPR
jgi:heat shock protein HtpX